MCFGYVTYLDYMYDLHVNQFSVYKCVCLCTSLR